ncbi:hypothetical protein [Bradyrhizobium sp. Leo121]|uniref:hypothetical protein n=1 Tax=Bradyrhizobium sp. Leo121 TaxID=1571195 RepID=UPI001028FB27|nr:hypothetical protein [Bradyrhizobium sp. Leo121]RZN21929.1 hypothetical protein CWO90_32455 [Bradyrhizobium sp. Leo121]
MSDEQTAETLATEQTATETPVNDGIIDLDAAEEVKEETEETKEEGKTEDAGEKEAGDEDKPKKLSGAQRAKIREQRLLSELQAREREIEELKRSAPAAKASEDEQPPKEEDFNGDWFAYQQALTAFNAGKAVRDEIRKDRETREASERETKHAALWRERSLAHQEREEDAREVITDYDEALAAAKVPVSPEVGREILSSDKSALLAYYLAKNPDKLTALNSMSGRELAREMGRLEATVKMPEAKKATSAPAPLGRPKGGASPSSPEADLQAWLKKKYG